MRQYVHIQEEEDIGFPERAYRIREEKLGYKGREILYHIVECSGITFCDRSYMSHFETVHVLGYINRWKYDTNEKGAAVSELEPIKDREEQLEIRGILQRGLMINVNF